MAATLLAPCHGHAVNAADALDQRAVEQPATSFFRKHRKKACFGVLIWLSGNLLGIYQGAWMSRPKNEPILVTEYEVPLDTSSFAVAEKRSVYAINDKGNVVTGTGAILPDSQDTLAIGAFRNHVLKLDRNKTLSIYRPSNSTWVPFTKTAFAQFATMEDQVIGITPAGEALVLHDPEHEPIRFSSSGAPSLLGRPIQFASAGRGFRKLITQTRPGYFRPDVVLVMGEDVLVFTLDGKQKTISKGTPERQALTEIERRASK
jgi:hypothetical protein